MAQLFDDEILSVVLKFTNPNRQDMLDADKVASRLSLSLDSVVRRAVSAGKAVGEIFDDIKKLEPALKKLEQRSGLIQGQAHALRSAQQILTRYTPARLEKMAEVQASKIAETSGTAALRRQLEKHGDLIKRLVATQEGRYERATRGSSTGRALFIDTETTGLNALKHQVVELTATLFTFNKKTGEIVDAAEKTYHGFQQLAFQARHQHMPPGVTAQMLQGQAISSTVMRRMIEKADFLVAHNAPFDKKFVERMVPQAAGAMWLDTMRGIPWRMLGQRSRAQQDLLRTHGIEPGAAHRSSADVASAIKLLGSRSPLGGQTYMGMLMAGQGPLNQSQQTLAVVKHMAEEIRSSLQQRLGESGRVGFPQQTPRYRATVENYAARAADNVSEIFSQYIVGAIEEGITARARRPSHSTGYGIKMGAGATPETTPGLLGESAISIDRRVGSVNEFLRNMAIMSGPIASGRFLKSYSGQQEYQEKIQRSRGRGRLLKGETHFGEDVALAAMSGVNTRLENERLGVGRREEVDPGMLRMSEQRETFIAKMLSQPWARPTRGFESAEVSSFVNKYTKNPAIEAIQTAAQMASHVGPRDPRFGALSNILLESQAAGRRVASVRAAESQRMAVDRLAKSMSGGGAQGGRFKNVIGEALRGLQDAGLASAFTAVSPFMSSGGIGGGSFATFLKYFRGRRQAGAAQQPGMSAEERVLSGVPLPEPTDVRGSMRRDVLDSKLRKLGDTVEQTTRAFQHYRDVVAPQRAREAATKYGEREMAITRGLSGTNASIDAQAQQLMVRRARARTAASRRLGDVQQGFEARSSGLGFAELESEMRYESALEMQKRRGNQLRRSKAFQEGRLKEEDIQGMLSGPVRTAQMRMVRAEYQSKVSQLTSPADIAALRGETAAKYAIARYGTGGGAELERRRAEYAQRVQGLFGGQTMAQGAETKAGRISEDLIGKEREFDAQASVLRQKRVAAEEKAAQQRAAAEAKFGQAATKVEADVAKKAEEAAQKRTQAERKAYDARVAFLKREDALMGRGGGGTGGRGGGGGARGGGDDFGTRSGLGIGIGFTMLAAYLGTMREVVKESMIYAARTETLTLVTEQMARVNGLNTQAVDAEVQAVRRLNITTQEAHTTIQKMMFAQLDVAKATNLARVAQDAAILANVNSSEALDRIILGIVTGQTRILHNMGLQVSMVNVMRQIRSEKRAAGEKGEPTELEKRQAMLNKVLLEGAKIMGSYERAMLTAGKQFNSLQREIQEAQNAIGKEFLPEFGRFVSLMTSGLHYVQQNGDAFAKLASAITAIGAAASTVGTLSFMKWMMTSGAVPWWAKLIGVGVGVATYKALNQDDAEALTKTATEQMEALNKKIAELQKERKNLLSNKQDTAEWKNTWDVNTKSMKSAADAQRAITEELTRQLGEQYDKRLKDLDDYLASMEGKQGFWKQLTATFRTSPENTTVGSILRGIPFLGTTGTEDIDEAKRQREELAGKLATGKITAEDIKREAAYQQLQRDRVKLLSPSLLNREKIEVQGVISDMINAEAELNKLDEKLSETGAIGLKARKAMGSPREKIMLDYEAQVAQVNKLGGALMDMHAKASKGDMAAQSKLQQVYKQLGGDSISAGEEKVNDFLERRNDIIGAAGEDRDIQLSKLNRQNAAQIAQIREQTAAEKINAETVEGNYASEESAIQKMFQLRQQTANKVKNLTGDVDQYQRQVAQNEEDRKVALMKLDENRAKAEKDRQLRVTLGEGERRAQGILAAPGDAEQAIRDAFKERLNSTAAITDENKRLDEQLNLLMELDDALIKLGRDRKRAAAEARIAEYEDQQELIMQIDRVVSSQGRTAKKRSLDEIERTRLGQTAIAYRRYSELQPITPAADQDALKQQRDQAIRQANIRAAEDTIKVMEERIQTAVSRLHDVYQQRIADQSKIAELSATSVLEEQDAAYNTYQSRLQYIQKEFDARKKAGDAIDEIERARDLARHDAEMEYLQLLLQQKRQQVDTIRSVSGSLFDIITSKSPDKQRQAKDYGIGLARGIGRTVFSNIAVETMKGMGGTLGSIIPGQEKTTIDPVTGKVTKTPTFLGKILSGTPFGKTATDKQIEAQKAVVKATEENIKAEDSLTAAIKSLDEAVRAAKGLIPGDKETVTTTIKTEAPKSSPFDIVPLFGGSGKDNPLIFHFKSGGAPNSTSDVVSVNLAQIGGTALSTAVPVYLVTSPFGQGSAPTASMFSIPSFGGSGSSGGTNTMGMLTSLATGGKLGGGGGGGASSIFSAFGDDKNSTAAGASPPGATWPGTNIPLPTGSGGGGAGGGGGGSGGGTTGSSGSKPNYLGGALLTGAGAYQAYTGFKKGGAGGIASGIGGVLTSAAGITSMIPGAQIATPFLAAGAMVADLIGSILGDSREQRGIDIQKYLAQNKYIAPTQLMSDMDVSGNLVSTAARGQLSRDTGIAAFPMSFTGTQYGTTPSKTWADPNVPEYYTIPGQQQYGGLSGNAQPITYNITLPVSAMDSKDVIARSGDIAAALKKEIQSGSDVSVALQQSMFGSGLT